MGRAACTKRPVSRHKMGVVQAFVRPKQADDGAALRKLEESTVGGLVPNTSTALTPAVQGTCQDSSEDKASLDHLVALARRLNSPSSISFGILVLY